MNVVAAGETDAAKPRSLLDHGAEGDLALVVERGIAEARENTAAGCSVARDLSYGPDPRNKLDVYLLDDKYAEVSAPSLASTAVGRS